MKQDFIRRSYNFDINSNENETGNILTGKPIVFNSRTNIGPFDEIIEIGALDNADLKDIRFLVNHDTSKIPLARSRNNNENSSMQLTIDESGMNIRVNLDVEGNSEAKNLYSAVKRGDLDGMSFMFSVNGEHWDDLDTDHPTRHITSISKVLEVSAVTWPAYQTTEIDARSLDALDNAKKEMEISERQANSLDNEIDATKREQETQALAKAEAEKRAIELEITKLKILNGGY